MLLLQLPQECSELSEILFLREVADDLKVLWIDLYLGPWHRWFFRGTETESFGRFDKFYTSEFRDNTAGSLLGNAQGWNGSK